MQLCSAARINPVHQYSCCQSSWTLGTCCSGRPDVDALSIRIQGGCGERGTSQVTQLANLSVVKVSMATAQPQEAGSWGPVIELA